MAAAPDKKGPSAAQLSSAPGAGGAFPVTRWSLVLAAGSEPTGVDRQAALESLCHGYWLPIYAFIRRRGHAPDDAQDLTQEFFLRVLGGSFMARATPDKGRFRSFLLGTVKHFLSDAMDRSMALKRGGGVAELPFDFDSGERMYAREPSHAETPERIFQRKWARAVLDAAVGKLREEFERDGKLDLFQGLKSFVGGAGGERYTDAAAGLGLSEPALKSAIHRLRKRYRDLLREEVAATVADASEVDEELRFLLQAISTRVAEVR